MLRKSFVLPVLSLVLLSACQSGNETLEKQKQKIDRFGVWLALIAWVPVIGDVVVIALGFYKTHPLWTSILLLIGKAGRFLVWNLLVSGFQGMIS